MLQLVESWYGVGFGVALVAFKTKEAPKATVGPEFRASSPLVVAFRPWA